MTLTPTPRFTRSESRRWRTQTQGLERDGVWWLIRTSVVEAYTRTQLRYLKLSVLLTDGDEFEAQLGDSAGPIQETGPQARQR